MKTLKFTRPKSEEVGDFGATLRHATEVAFDENTLTDDILIKQIRELEKEGFDVHITLKLKMPKN